MRVRGIQEDTIRVFRIRQDQRFIKAAGEKRRVIAFNYINHRGVTVGVKYRDSEKNFIWAPGSVQVPYGIHLAYDSQEVAVSEGEFEPLSWYECGISAISAPSAPPAPKEGKVYQPRLEWMDGYWDWIASRKRVVLALDSDAPGRALQEEFARRIGKEKVFIAEFPEGCKDPNDVLRKHGKDKLIEIYKTARPYPLEGILDADTEHEALEALYKDGFPQGWRTGFSHMDSVFRFHPGQVTLLTGVPGHGKSSFVKQVMVALAENCDTRWMVYSAEEASVAMALANIYSIKTGKPFMHENPYKKISLDELRDLKPWVSDHFKYIKTDEDSVSIDDILERARQLVTRNGIDGLVIDNMSTVEGILPKSGETRHHAIGDMLTKVIRAARHLGIHIIMVAHPKKMDRVGNLIRIPNGYDVGDSSHYYNKPDNGITVYRNSETHQAEIHFWKVRFSYAGENGRTAFVFDKSTGRFTPGIDTWNDGDHFQGQPLGARFRDV